ncbi:uncharacterized protein A1O9_11264 [Exophiala aquamarina CBS 119918]|uniref:BZIP domain-containing protein n=1 Tax=Exophiala aquamarina CBS 119918 TaxID=1182545 RepID=A0A072NZK3_9EURO|nr:uncharacterized protein A1O9_11264 [Exophiala aquamarina CBS 119918]KEF52847.1 hypothetical protein A1O9_11264 [Exophiala aquamarina CBS 119918]
MALRYPQQNYYLYGQPQWPEDLKPALTEDDASSILDDKVLEAPTPADMTPADASDTRRPPMPKMEDDYAWHDRPQPVVPQRHYSQPSIPLSSPHPQYFSQVNPVNCQPSYVQQQSWPLAARSEANTPTPFFTPVQEPFDSHVQYHGGPVNFTAFPQTEPVSAVSMSPQSSQGGWASTTSSDVADTNRPVRHRFRGSSPMLVVRSDGIRKKNAKFEIPKERNLQNIDNLISLTTDEEEKKELKQQKRLLRNRQAALDSRQRKKNHTEKLEQDKKAWDNQKHDLEESVAHLEHTLNQEREQWLQQRQQYEHFIQSLQYERDEAIRTKTLETAELRRMNNILKDSVRDLERQQATRTFASNPSNAFANDFSDFRALDLEDTWEDEFSLINSEDLKMEESDALQRQATPRPPTSSAQTAAPLSLTKPLDVKVDAGFSWNTFYMCLLSGAFIVSQAGSKATNAPTSVDMVAPNMPILSDDYRAEAGQVLSAVLASGPEVAHEILPPRPALPAQDEFGVVMPGPTTSVLDNLHANLVTPSRQQQAQAAFSMSAASYNHITNPEGMFDDDDDDAAELKPTRLQQLFAHMQAEKDDIDKMTGLSGKASQRSVLLDRVPEKVLRDFREMIARVE